MRKLNCVHFDTAQDAKKFRTFIKKLVSVGKVTDYIDYDEIKSKLTKNDSNSREPSDEIICLYIIKRLQKKFLQNSTIFYRLSTLKDSEIIKNLMDVIDENFEDETYKLALFTNKDETYKFFEDYYSLDLYMKDSCDVLNIEESINSSADETSHFSEG